jgi:hypothetical protein
MDLKTAEKYGDLCIVLPGADRPPCGADALPTLRQAFRDFRDTDFLVIAGDLDLYTWAAALALQATGGKINLLKWDNRGRSYDVVKAPDGLWAEDDELVTT